MNLNTIAHELLKTYGWNDHWENAASQLSEKYRQLTPARVMAQHSHSYQIMTPDGEQTAVVSGKYEFQAQLRSDFPAVGDWVMTEPMPGEQRSIIHAMVPRRSAMIRRAAGGVMDDQVVGANMDYLFITSALNEDFNVRRIERYMITAWESGATPVILLTKADLCDEPVVYKNEVEAVAPGVPVHFVSALRDQGKEQLAPYMRPGATIAVTGSSGVGKSTLLNWLAGEEKQHTSGIRESDARGRHTTTHRELFLLPGGALVLDTPGMRELQLWDAQDGWEQAFSDIEELAAQCRYRDCKHNGTEPGCAVTAAIAEGTLDARRFSNYKKTERELAHLARKERATAKKHSKQAGGKSAGGKPAVAKARKSSRDYAEELD
ncbi:ribosome small subunit-dependent GTPase A [Cohnella lubricantis]|uniref:ribosome small subunit-dependent GTPase A n=1 Tax=Cohnella lubricantis TaxID=2163172 RepID=UPI001FD9688D|nr:ribosome small subunit-dependent GTPase A [Cohnella lubricantis]MBP2120030.1 ribosome biogenesis GTPase [Cohnella lubricantis]